MQRYAVALEIADMTNRKWGQIEKALNTLVKTAGVMNWRFDVNQQATVSGKRPTVEIAVEVVEPPVKPAKQSEQA